MDPAAERKILPGRKFDVRRLERRELPGGGVQQPAGGGYGLIAIRPVPARTSISGAPVSARNSSVACREPCHQP